MGSSLSPFRDDIRKSEPYASISIRIFYRHNFVGESFAAQAIVVAHFPLCVAALPPAALAAPADRPLYGIGGLFWYDGDLIGMQNGIQPWRLLRTELIEDATAVRHVRVVEFANDALTPTTGAIDGGRNHYVGQGPAPENPPSRFPASMAPFLGKTVIMTAPLDAGT